MHRCYTVQDWIGAWTKQELLHHGLGQCLGCSDGDGGTSGLCPSCRAVLESLPGVPDEVVDCPRCMAAQEVLADSLDRVGHFDPAVAAEIAESDALYEELVALPPRQRTRAIVADARFQLWSLCQRFLSEGESLWRHDPRRAHALTETGVLITDTLDDERYHPRWVADLRAKAHAYLGNTYRILKRFSEAEWEIDSALRHLRRGIENGILEARVLSLQASLRIDQGRHDEAENLLARVADFYRAGGQRTELARTQLKRASILETRGEYRAAAEECAEAFGNLDPKRDSHLSILASQNAVFNLLHAGEVERARGLFSTLAPTDERMVLLQRRWIEAHLLHAEGRMESANLAYEDTRRGYAEEGLPYDVGLVALDQAVAAFEAGDFEMVRQLAQEAGALFDQAGARRETLAVLRVLRTAIDQGTVNRAVLTAIRKRVADTRPSS